MLYFLVSWLVHLTPVIRTYSESHYMEMHYVNFAELKKKSIYETVQDHHLIFSFSTYFLVVKFV